MPKAKLEVGNTLKAALNAFEQNRGLILRLTLGLAVLNAATSLIGFAGPAGFAISLGFTVLLGTAYGGMVTAIVCVPGKHEEIGELWAITRPVLARLVWVTLIALVGLIAALLSELVPVLALLVIPWIFIAVFFSVANQSVVVERTKVLGALGRSARLVRGRAWPVFGYLILLALASMTVLLIVILIAAPFGSGPAAGVLISFLSNLASPILAVGAAALFNRLTEIEREEKAATASQEPPAPY